LLSLHLQRLYAFAIVGGKSIQARFSPRRLIRALRRIAFDVGITPIRGWSSNRANSQGRIPGCQLAGRPGMPLRFRSDPARGLGPRYGINRTLDRDSPEPELVRTPACPPSTDLRAEIGALTRGSVWAAKPSLKSSRFGLMVRRCGLVVRRYTNIFRKWPYNSYSPGILPISIE
jgi:hypothetical protein